MENNRHKGNNKKITIAIISIVVIVGIIGVILALIVTGNTVKTLSQYQDKIEKLSVRDDIASIQSIEDKFNAQDLQDENYLLEAENIFMEHKEAIEKLKSILEKMKVKDEALQTTNSTLISWCDTKMSVNEKGAEIIKLTEETKALHDDSELEAKYSEIIDKTLEIQKLEEEAQSMMKEWKDNINKD